MPADGNPCDMESSGQEIGAGETWQRKAVIPRRIKFAEPPEANFNHQADWKITLSVLLVNLSSSIDRVANPSAESGSAPRTRGSPSWLQFRRIVQAALKSEAWRDRKSVV